MVTLFKVNEGREAPSLWRKFLLWAFPAMAFLTGCGYFAGIYAIDKASRELLDLFPHYGAQLGGHLVSPTFKGVRVSSFHSIAWDGIECYFCPANQAGLSKTNMFSIRIRSLELSLLDLSFHKFALAGEGIEIHLIERQVRGEDLRWGPAEHDFATGRFVADRFRLRFNLDPSNPIAAAKRVVRDLLSLARTGRTSAHVELAGW